uniref:Uncharacterized protein n=1 Tax=Glossina pallidipes TaxID=7398 RepID=A0A1A9ZLG0_GLOPL
MHLMALSTVYIKLPTTIDIFHTKNITAPTFATAPISGKAIVRAVKVDLLLRETLTALFLLLTLILTINFTTTPSSITISNSTNVLVVPLLLMLLLVLPPLICLLRSLLLFPISLNSAIPDIVVTIAFTSIVGRILLRNPKDVI